MRKSHHQVRMIQKLVAKEEEEDKIRQANAQKKAIEDARKNLIKNLEAEQKHMRAEHMRRIKVQNDSRFSNMFMFIIHLPSPRLESCTFLIVQIQSRLFDIATRVLKPLLST